MSSLQLRDKTLLRKQLQSSFFCWTQIFPCNHLVDLDGTSDARDCHMTIAYDVNNASLIIQDGAENADVRRNTLAEKVTLAYHRNPTEYHRNPKIMCCVLLTSNAIMFGWTFCQFHQGKRLSSDASFVEYEGFSFAVKLIIRVFSWPFDQFHGATYSPGLIICHFRRDLWEPVVQ